MGPPTDPVRFKAEAVRLTKMIMTTIGLSMGMFSQAQTIPRVAAENSDETVTLPPAVGTSRQLRSDSLDKPACAATKRGRTLDSKSLRQTGICLRLELGPDPEP
jgi:hypothetical protein